MLVSVDESVTDWLTWIDVEDRVVAIDGLVLLTVRGSQPLVAPLLFASPLYTASKLSEAVELNVTALEFGITPPVTVTVDATVPGAVQAMLVKNE